MIYERGDIITTNGEIFYLVVRKTKNYDKNADFYDLINLSYASGLLNCFIYYNNWLLISDILRKSI